QAAPQIEFDRARPALLEVVGHGDDELALAAFAAAYQKGWDVLPELVKRAIASGSFDQEPGKVESWLERVSDLDLREIVAHAPLYERAVEVLATKKEATPANCAVLAVAVGKAQTRSVRISALGKLASCSGRAFDTQLASIATAEKDCHVK